MAIAPPDAFMRAVGARRRRPPWEEALAARSQAQNDLYGLGGTPDAGGGGAGTSGAPSTSGTAATGIEIAGYDPDYEALIKSDFNLLAGESDLTRAEGQIQQARRDAIRRAVIATGLVPTTAVPDLDQQDIAAAKANPFSRIAEATRGRLRGSTDLRARLAARGILGKGAGALQGGEGRLQEGFERETTSATQQLLDLISNVEGQSVDKRNEIGRRRAELREAAARRIQADPRYQPKGKATAKLDPGSGLYVTDDGRWYDVNGNRVGAPGAAAPGAGTTSVDATPSARPAPDPFAPFRRGHVDF